MKKGAAKQEPRIPDLEPTDAQFGPLADIRKRLAPVLAPVTGLTELQVAK